MPSLAELGNPSGQTSSSAVPGTNIPTNQTTSSTATTLENPLKIYANLDAGESIDGWLAQSVGLYDFMQSSGNYSEYLATKNAWTTSAAKTWNTELANNPGGTPVRSSEATLGGFTVDVRGWTPDSVSISSLGGPINRYGQPGNLAINIDPLLKTLKFLGYKPTQKDLDKYGSVEGWAYWTIRNNHITEEQFNTASVGALEQEVKRTSGQGIAKFFNKLSDPQFAIPFIVGMGLNLGLPGMVGNTTTALAIAGEGGGAAAAQLWGMLPSLTTQVLTAAGVVPEAWNAMSSEEQSEALRNAQEQHGTQDQGDVTTGGNRDLDDGGATTGQKWHQLTPEVRAALLAAGVPASVWNGMSAEDQATALQDAQNRDDTDTGDGIDGGTDTGNDGLGLDDGGTDGDGETDEDEETDWDQLTDAAQVALLAVGVTAAIWNTMSDDERGDALEDAGNEADTDEDGEGEEDDDDDAVLPWTWDPNDPWKSFWDLLGSDEFQDLFSGTMSALSADQILDMYEDYVDYATSVASGEVLQQDPFYQEALEFAQSDTMPERYQSVMDYIIEANNRYGAAHLGGSQTQSGATANIVGESVTRGYAQMWNEDLRSLISGYGPAADLQTAALAGMSDALSGAAGATNQLFGSATFGGMNFLDILSNLADAGSPAPKAGTPT